MIYVYDGDSYHRCDTLKEAEEILAESVSAARDIARYEGEWPDWMESMRAYDDKGKSTKSDDDPMSFPCVLRVVKINVQRPSSALDEDGYDDEGDGWPDSSAYNCDYEIEEIAV